MKQAKRDEEMKMAVSEFDQIMKRAFQSATNEKKKPPGVKKAKRPKSTTK